jgi:chromate transporter
MMTWGELLTVFLRAAFLSVNGGTTLALLEQDLVHRLHVLSPSEFSTGVAVGAASPGPFGYGCIALGFLADGWRGALVATFSSWLPAFLAIPLRSLHRRLETTRWISGLTWGVAAGGTGLLLAMTANLTVDALRGWREVVLGALLLLLLLRRRPASLALLAAALAGALFMRPGS